MLHESIPGNPGLKWLLCLSSLLNSIRLWCNIRVLKFIVKVETTSDIVRKAWICRIKYQKTYVAASNLPNFDDRLLPRALCTVSGFCSLFVWTGTLFFLLKILDTILWSTQFILFTFFTLQNKQSACHLWTSPLFCM